MKRVFIIMFAGLLFFPDYVCAGNVLNEVKLDAVVSYQSDDCSNEKEKNVLVIDGTVKNTDSRNFNVIVYPSVYDTAALTNVVLENLLAANKAFVIAGRIEGERFSGSLGLPENFNNGMYTVRITVGSQQKKYSFWKTSAKDTKAVIAGVNAAVSVTETESILQQHKNDLHIDVTEFEKCAEAIAKVFFYGKPIGGYKTNDFIHTYMCAIGYGKLTNITDLVGFREILSAYGGYFGISYETDFDIYSLPVQNGIVKQLRTYRYEHMLFSNYYHEVRLLAEINTAEDSGKLQSLVMKQDNLMIINESLARKGQSLDMERYGLLTNYEKLLVFGKTRGKSYTDFIMFQKDFNAEISRLFQTNDNSQGSSGGGSGGSAGGSGDFSSGYTMTEDKNNQSVKEHPAFSDIVGHWAEDIIKTLVDMGMIHGFEDGTFRPDDNVTRAEFAKLLVEMLKLPDEQGDAFADVSAGEWYYGCVYAASNVGIVRGFDSEFYPNNQITREDAAVMMFRAVDGYGMDGSTIFGDSAEISDYATEAVGILAANGLINGFENKFFPKDTTTRAEAATMIYNIVQFREKTFSVKSVE